jgi:hypothetical protein
VSPRQQWWLITGLLVVFVLIVAAYARGVLAYLR